MMKTSRGRRPKKGRTLHYDKIPDSHCCNCCGNDKTLANFSVREVESVFLINAKCNYCTRLRVEIPTDKKPLTIREKIAIYFKEKVYAE